MHEQLGHVGSEKMLWSLKQSCGWPRMDRAVKSYGRACAECQRMRKEKVGKAPMGEMQVHKVPFEHVLLGHFLVLMGIDTYSRIFAWHPDIPRQYP